MNTDTMTNGELLDIAQRYDEGDTSVAVDQYDAVVDELDARGIDIDAG
jgi:hypothetical protein